MNQEKNKTLTAALAAAVATALAVGFAVLLAAATLTATTLLACNSYADEARATLGKEVRTMQSLHSATQEVATKIKSNRRAVLRSYPFTIYFPWRTCRTNYRAHVRYPSVIQGIACGTRVRCVRRGGNRYMCRY